MSVENVLLLLCGLAQFLFGMNTMSEGFKHMAGTKLQKILEKLTSTKISGLLVGIGVTAIIQSSSATTSMLVGFVNAGIMKVSQTVCVIMGANIGTTVTGLLIALNISAIASLIAFIGVVFIMFLNNEKLKSVGEILVGLGLVFIGLSAMSEAMQPLRNSPFFLDLIISLKNPIFGIGLGAIFTALIQSSSASVGIIQALAKSGLIGVGDVLYFNCGQHIGTCITAVLTALGFNRDAKRVAVIHVAFNVIGTFAFTLVYLLFPMEALYERLAPGNPVAQIALMHTIFSIGSTVILYPFDKMLNKIAYIVIPDQHSKKELKLEVTQPEKKDNAAAELYGIKVEINQMFNMVRESIEKGLAAILERKSVVPYVKDMEDKIDIIHDGIIKSISKTMASNITAEESKVVSEMFQINKDIERLGDHAMNLAERGEELLHCEALCDEMVEEMTQLSQLVLESLKAIDHITRNPDRERYHIVDSNEAKMDELFLVCRNNQIKRMQENKTSVEEGIIYTEILTDIERISDHLHNIATELYETK